MRHMTTLPVPALLFCTLNLQLGKENWGRPRGQHGGGMCPPPQPRRDTVAAPREAAWRPRSPRHHPVSPQSSARMPFPGSEDGFRASHLVGGIFAQHQGEDALAQPQPGAGPAAVAAVHEDVVLPAVPVEVAVQHHLPLRQHPARIRIRPPTPPRERHRPAGSPRPHLTSRPWPAGATHRGRSHGAPSRKPCWGPGPPASSGSCPPPPHRG